jgi:hypothetical protein
MALKKNILWTIGGPEGSPGTAVARTHVIPVRDNPGLTAKADRIVDPVIAGARMDVGEYLSKIDTSGPIPLSPRVCPGYGKLLKSALGTESAPVQVGAVIRIRSTAAGASTKLVADTTANTLKSYIGAAGAEAADAAFGTAGSIDLTAVPTDTVAELVSLIDGYATYECQLVAGDPATVSGLILDITTQAKGRWAYIFFGSAASGAYLRTFSADLTDTQHPVYSIEGEGYVNPLLYDGCVVDQIKHTAALGGFLEGDADVLGMKELDGAAASGLSIANLEDVDPLLFWKGSTEFGGKDFTFMNNVGFTINNNHNKETYGQSTAARQYQQKTLLAISGDLQLALDANSYLHRSDIFSSVLTALSLVFKGKTIGASMLEMLIVELPYVSVTSPFDFTDRNGAFDAKINWKAFNPKGTKWDVPVKIHFISKDVAAF